MDQNKAIPQEGNDKLSKLENDLESIAQKANEVRDNEVTTEPEVLVPPVEPVGPASVVSDEQPNEATMPVANKKQSSLMKLALVLALLAVVVVVTYMFSSKDKNQPTPTPAIILSPSAIPTEMPNASESANPFLETPEATTSAASSPSATINP